MKKFKLLPIALLFSLGLSGCSINDLMFWKKNNQQQQQSGEKKDDSSKTDTGDDEEGETSAIKSLVATIESKELKLGEAVSVASYYKLTGYKTLTSKQKKVSIVSSDPEAVKITGNIMTGMIADRNATITITSQEDTTKSCSFTVNVKDIFFNRTYSEINGDDDLSKELIADGGIVSTDGGTSDMLILNKEASTSFIIETKIAVNKVSDGELWPKFGIVFKQVDENKDLTLDYMIVFLDGPMNRVQNGEASWTDFGYCEIANATFGWDTQPATAKHKENVFIKNDPINYNEFFTLKCVVEGRKIHTFLGYGEGESATEVYMFTVEGQDYIFGEGAGKGFIPGFFQFNSVCTYKEYSYTTDAEAIAAQMAGVTERLADYDNKGDHPGTSFHE